MKIIKRIITTVVFCLLLSGCGGRDTIPKDWVCMPYEEAVGLYHSVDFTIDNINEYFSINEIKDERYNEWDELEAVTYKTVWEIKPYVRFDTPEDEFLMDYTCICRNQALKLDPVTLEVLEVLDESSYEKSNTISGFDFVGITMSYYTVNYEKNGSVVLNEDGELIVSKTTIENFHIERVRGHMEWIQDIPEQYMMDTDHYSYGDGMSTDAYIRFFVVETDDYYYTYENYDHDTYNDFQTKAFKKDGSGWRCVGNSISFVRGFEDDK